MYITNVIYLYIRSKDILMRVIAQGLPPDLTLVKVEYSSMLCFTIFAQHFTLMLHLPC